MLTVSTRMLTVCVCSLCLDHRLGAFATGVVSSLIVDLSMQPITPDNPSDEITTSGAKRIREKCGGEAQG